MTKKTPLEIAIDLHKTKAALARALGVKPCYISKMIRERHVPVEQCRAIERVTGGKVTAEQLRPDVFAPVAHIKPTKPKRKAA